MDEADVVADVYSLLQAGERKEADEAADSAAIVSSIKAAATLVAISGEQEYELPQVEVEQEVEEQSTKGALNLTLQRLLSLPLPPPPPAFLEHSVDQPHLPSSDPAVPSFASLPPLPALPTVNPVALANHYLSNSHTARTTVTQQLCTDRPDQPTSSQLPSQPLPTDSSSSPPSSSSITLTSSLTAADGVPVLRPVYAVPSLQTRYLNVELLSEMELVMYAVQKRMEQLVSDKLKEWIRRDEPPPQPAVQQPQQHTTTVQQRVAEKREAGDATIRISSPIFSSPQPSQRIGATPSSSSPSLSPGAPVPSSTPTALAPLPASSAVFNRSSSSESPAPLDVQPIVFPPATTPLRSRALSVAERHVATVASSPPMPTKQLRKQSAASTRTSTPATPHSTTASSVSYYHTSPPFTPNHNVAAVPVASLSRPQAYSPYHSATSPSTVTVPVLPPRPPSSGGSPRTQRARAAHSHKKEYTSPGAVYATADVAMNGNGKGVNGSSGGSRGREEKPNPKHLRSKSLVGYGTGLQYVRDGT